MRFSQLASTLTLLGAACCATSSIFATPLITALVQNGTTSVLTSPPTPIVNPNFVVSSATEPEPQPTGAGTASALGDEAYSMATRTHEYTAVRTDPTTFALTTSATTGVLQPFPSYLTGLEYVQLANENRAVTDYSLDITFSSPVHAYLLLDNRNNGASSGTKSNASDPTLTGNLAWVVNDGWTRVNTGFMPSGQADYLGHDEGATVATPDLRTHTSSGLVAGSGNGLNNFFAIYTKDFPAGPNIGVTKAMGNNSPNMYGLAVAIAVPEPSTLALSLLAACCVSMTIVRRYSSATHS